MAQLAFSLLLLTASATGLLFKTPHSSCERNSDCPGIPGHQKGLCLQKSGLLCLLSLHSWWYGGSCYYTECAECHFNRDCRHGEYCTSNKKCVRQARDEHRYGDRYGNCYGGHCGGSGGSGRPGVAVGAGGFSIALGDLDLGSTLGLGARPVQGLGRRQHGRRRNVDKNMMEKLTTTTVTSTTATTTTSTTTTEPLSADSTVESAIISSNQSKLAKLLNQNNQLEKKMKLMTQQYGRLIDQLSIKQQYNDIV